MIVNRSSRVVLICAAVALAGGCALAPGAEAQTPATPKAKKSEAGAMHKVAIQVNQNDKALMDLALNNAKNILDYYKAKGETVAVEIVTYGPGLHMLRADTSPVKERIAPMALENSNLRIHRLRQHPGQPEQGRGQARLPAERGQGHALGCGSSDGAAEAGLRLHQAVNPRRARGQKDISGQCRGRD